MMKNKFTIFFLISYTILLFLFGFYVQHSRSGESPNPQILEVTVTAYSPSPHITDKDPLITASGKKVTPEDLFGLKLVAVSRNLMEEYDLKYGDEIWISFFIEDTMHKRVENTVDLFLRNLELARQFGIQRRKIIILK